MQPVGQSKFAFGKNWLSYAKHALTPEKVQAGRAHFRKLCAELPFENCAFLDIGFGQGLALYYATELGANVTGIDPDRDNIAAQSETAKFFPNLNAPQVFDGSILDHAFVDQNFAGFDIVYSWGVLHHTGNLRQAIRNAAALVKPGGFLIVAIYHKHWTAPLWRVVKRTYNRSGKAMRGILLAMFYCPLLLATWVALGKNPFRGARGMDFYHDLRDWIGGYPYEYMSKDQIISSVGKNFELLRYMPPLVPTGNHQLVFKRA